MTSRDFVYWLQGYMEVANPKTIPEEQVKIIQNHLNLVFKHEIDPSIDGGNPGKQEELQYIHDDSNDHPNFNLDKPNTLLRC